MEVILVNVWYSVLIVFSLGVLACLDGYMNIAVEQTEEYVNGQLKNKYGDAFLRGNNGKFQSLSSLLSLAQWNLDMLAPQ